MVHNVKKKAEQRNDREQRQKYESEVSKEKKEEETNTIHVQCAYVCDCVRVYRVAHIYIYRVQPSTRYDIREHTRNIISHTKSQNIKYSDCIFSQSRDSYLVLQIHAVMLAVYGWGMCGFAANLA